MKTFPLSAQLNSSNINFLENLSLNRSISQPVIPVKRKTSPFNKIRANKDLRTTTKQVYQENILRLLDNLNSPVLLLPRVGEGTFVRQIGFFTDLRFTGNSTLSLIAKIASSYNAGIVLFNISESHLPPMDGAYAEGYFRQQGLSEVNGIPVKLVNLPKGNTSQLESIFTQHDIDMICALPERKNLLYNLVA